MHSTSSSWPQRVKPSRDAPNVIVFLTDDVGYGACSTFGGPVETHHLDRLAEGGLRFTHFHTTAVCSPTRASLLTVRSEQAVTPGRHRVRVSVVMDEPVPGAPATVTQEIDGQIAGTGRIERTLRVFVYTEGFSVGSASVTSVSPDYEVPDSRFSGCLRVEVTLD